MRRPCNVLRAGIALAGAALVVGGCGGGGGGSSDTATTTDRPTLPVRIDNPKPDVVLTAARREGARLGVTLTVSGRADAAQTIEVAASCSERECTRVVFSDGAGDWSARLDVLLPARRHRLAITAGYPTAVAAAARPVVRISVRAPATEPRRRKSPRRGSSTSSPTPTPTPTPKGAPATSVPRPAPETTTQAPPAPPVTTSPPTPGASRQALLLIGDSLAVGIKSLLPSLLPGWRVTVDGRVSRPLAEGMGIIGATPIPSDGGTVLAVSLFTNDDPTRTAQLQAAVRTTLDRVGSRGCVIWATIVRPPLNGVSYAAANNLLQHMAESEPRLRIVPWAEQVSARPSLVGGDGVHPTPVGYRLRAQLYARAAQSC